VPLGPARDPAPATMLRAPRRNWRAVLLHVGAAIDQLDNLTDAWRDAPQQGLRMQSGIAKLTDAKTCAGNRRAKRAITLLDGRRFPVAKSGTPSRERVDSRLRPRNGAAAGNDRRSSRMPTGTAVPGRLI
jgi:hypothetical protein